MKPNPPLVPILLALAALVMLSAPAAPASAAPAPQPDDPPVSAGISQDPIHVNTEPGGDIDLIPPGGQADGIFENVIGAFFWNGSKWVTDSTSAHTYFTDAAGNRLKNYTLLATLDGSAAPGVVFNQWGFTVTQSTYTYSITAADHSGIYRYQAVEYSIATTLPREKYILRSRGTGNGTAQPYLDIYIQENTDYTVALRGDPFMYSYDLSAEQAIQIDSDTQGLSASLPTTSPGARAQYWLDINGGSDLGGLSFYFHTAPIAPVKTKSLGSGFPTEFRVKFTDGNLALEEFMLLPRIISETLLPAVNLYLPLVKR